MPVSRGSAPPIPYGNLAASGYTVVVNADHRVAESDYDNNNFTVEKSVLLQLAWRVAFAEFCHVGWGLVGYTNTWNYNLQASVVGGESSRTIAEWRSDEVEIPSNEHVGRAWCTHDFSNFRTNWFTVNGDETLVITTSANLDIPTHGNQLITGGTEYLNAANDFGGTTVIPYNLDAYCYRHGVDVTNDVHGDVLCGEAISTGTCPQDFDSGMHLSGMYIVDVDAIRNFCYWSTTFMLYEREVDTANP